MNEIFPGMTSYGMLLDVVHHQKEKEKTKKRKYLILILLRNVGI